MHYLLNLLCTSDFLVFVVTIHKWLAYLKGFSMLLQERPTDESKTLTMETFVISALKGCRENVETFHANFFEKAVHAAESGFCVSKTMHV